MSVDAMASPATREARDSRLLSLSRQRRAAHRVARERLAGYRDAWAAGRCRWQDLAVYEAPSNTRQAGRATALQLFQPEQDHLACPTGQEPVFKQAQTKTPDIQSL
jgi:DNA-binding LacI/PurR family transcriptional regulator